VFVLCCVVRGFCDGLITHSEESYRVCVYVCLIGCVRVSNFVYVCVSNFLCVSECMCASNFVYLCLIVCVRLILCVCVCV
jgi:hypothetical protein